MTTMACNIYSPAIWSRPGYTSRVCYLPCGRYGFQDGPHDLHLNKVSLILSQLHDISSAAPTDLYDSERDDVDWQLFLCWTKDTILKATTLTSIRGFWWK